MKNVFYFILLSSPFIIVFKFPFLNYFHLFNYDIFNEQFSTHIYLIHWKCLIIYVSIVNIIFIMNCDNTTMLIILFA